MEAGPRNIPVKSGPATDAQKALVSADKGRAQAVRKASGLRDFRQGARKIAPVGDFTDTEGAGKAVQKAKEFAATTSLNDVSGRVVANPAVKQAAKDNPGEDPREVATRNAADDAEMERQKIIDMPRGPERQKLLGKDMERRMRLAARAGRPGAMDDNTATNQALDQEMRKGEGDKAWDSFKDEGGIEVSKQSGMRHNWQPEVDMQYDTPEPQEFPDPSKSTSYTHQEDGRQYQYNNETSKWQPEMSSDDVGTLISVTADPKTRDDYELSYDKNGEVVSRIKQANTQVGDQSHVNEPSAAEINYFRNAPEGQELLKALDSGDAKAVQNLAFTHNAGEVGQPHESVDEYLARADIRTDLSRRGLDGGDKLDAVYGGTFDDPKLTEIASKYQVEGAPDGVYNTRAMEKDGGKRGGKWANKELEQIYKQVFKNREYEVARTYMRQNGRDAYAPWEGHRSIEQMNLEHIGALNATEGDRKGYDHPDNWSWASEPLNKAKGAGKLGDRIQKFNEPQPGESMKVGKSTFTDILKKGEEASGKKRANLKKEMETEVPELKYNKGDYGKLSQDEIDDARERYKKTAKDNGVEVSDAEAKKTFPDRNARPGYDSDGEEAFDEDRRRREAERMEDDTYLMNLKQELGLNSLESAAGTVRGVKGLEMLAQKRKGSVVSEPEEENDEM